MSFRDLIPQNWGKKQLAERDAYQDPFSLAQNEMSQLINSLTQDFWSPMDIWGGRSWENLVPNLDVEETEKHFKITAELPGMDEKDVSVSLSKDTLTIKGEKKIEKEENKSNLHHVERSYGSFQRSVVLPAEVRKDKVEASFKKGLLTIILPKTRGNSNSQQDIPVKGE